MPQRYARMSHFRRFLKHICGVGVLNILRKSRLKGKNIKAWAKNCILKKKYIYILKIRITGQKRQNDKQSFKNEPKMRKLSRLSHFAGSGCQFRGITDVKYIFYDYNHLSVSSMVVKGANNSTSEDIGNLITFAPIIIHQIQKCPFLTIFTLY